MRHRLLPLALKDLAGPVACQAGQSPASSGAVPVRGAADAKVVILVFGDFACTTCSGLEPVLTGIRQEFPTDVQIVFKHNPAPGHAEAMLAHEAAVEAGRQGKFWEMHDLLAANPSKLEPDQLTGYARALKLDVEAFSRRPGRPHPSRRRRARHARGEGSRHQRHPDALHQRAPRQRRAAGGGAHYADQEPRRRWRRQRPGAAPPTALDLTGAPIRGAANAPVTIVEFSDFQCGFCFRVNPTLVQLLDRYPGKVRVLFKHSPIEGHTAAPLAHRAAFAAQQQGKFWEMHDRIFANQRAMDREALLAHAAALGLERGKFIADLDGPAATGGPRSRPGRGRQGRRRRHPDLLHRWRAARRRPADRGLRRGDRQGTGGPDGGDTLIAGAARRRARGRRADTIRPCNEPGWCPRSSVLLAVPAAADPRLPAIFSDHMVLQQQMPLGVWGWAAPDERIEVRLRAQRVTTTADRQGRWQVTLAPETAGGPDELVVAGATATKRFTDVLIGEVWIGSGQSNMQWEVRQAQDADTEIAAANHPRIRLFSVKRVTALEPKDDVTPMDAAPTWMVATPASVTNFSAIGYFFSRELQKARGNVPIGFIHSSWGGTPAEAWTRRDVLAEDPALAPLLAQYRRIEGEYPSQRYGYERRLPDLDRGRQGLEGGQPGCAADAGHAGAARRAQNPHRPATLWNAIIAPITSFAIRGVL